MRHRFGTAEDSRRCVGKDGRMDGWMDALIPVTMTRVTLAAVCSMHPHFTPFYAPKMELLRWPPGRRTASCLPASCGRQTSSPPSILLARQPRHNLRVSPRLSSQRRQEKKQKTQNRFDLTFSNRSCMDLCVRKRAASPLLRALILPIPASARPG